MKCVYGRAGVRYVITKFSRMDSLPNFLIHGAPLRARFARAGAPLKNFHLIDVMSMFPASWYTKMNELCTTIIDHFNINRVGKFYIIFDRFSRDFRVFSWTQSAE